MAILSLFKTPKRKTSRRSYLIKALDDLISKQVRERDGYHCRKCGRTPCYHHHLMTKKRLSTRWDLANGVPLCFHDHRWAHAAPEEFRQWVIGWFGKEQYEALYIKSQFRTSFKTCDLEWLLKEMRRAA